MLGLPEIPGVWSLEEDAILREGNARRIEELDEKHGYGEALDRRRFLDTWRSASKQQRR
jgi:TRF2-interacting telomeric protein/Rap1 - C terminal domain